MTIRGSVVVPQIPNRLLLKAQPRRMSNGDLSGEAILRFQHQLRLAPQTPASRDKSLFPAGSVGPEKSGLGLLPPDSCMWLERNTHPEHWSHLTFTPRNLDIGRHGYVMFASSNHCTAFLHVKDTFPSLPIFKLLSLPFSLRRWKELGGNIQNFASTSQLVVPEHARHPPGWWCPFSLCSLCLDALSPNISLVNSSSPSSDFRSDLIFSLGPPWPPHWGWVLILLSCWHPHSHHPALPFIFPHSTYHQACICYRYLFVMFIVDFALPPRLKLCKAVIFVYFIQWCIPIA